MKSKFEMDERQALLFNALTPLQKEIALNSISGMNDIDAYKASKGKAKTISAMESGACEILSNPKVSCFIKSMANQVVNPAIMTRDEMLEELTKLSRVVAPDLAENGISKITELKAGFDIKLKSMDQLAKLAGYEAPAKTDLTSSDGSMTPTFAGLYGKPKPESS